MRPGIFSHLFSLTRKGAIYGFQQSTTRSGDQSCIPDTVMPLSLSGGHCTKGERDRGRRSTLHTLGPRQGKHECSYPCSMPRHAVARCQNFRGLRVPSRNPTMPIIPSLQAVYDDVIFQKALKLLQTQGAHFASVKAPSSCRGLGGPGSSDDSCHINVCLVYLQLRHCDAPY